MIAFLVLCYVAILATLVWLKVIKLNLWWKLSPLLFMLVCFFVLIFPLQWGAPSGTVNVYQYVIEIIPNVTGEVVDVPVEPMKPLKKGDVLFQIDRRPYQAKVKQLEAALAEAEQAVPQLEAALGTAKANLEHATAQRDLQKLELDRNESIRKRRPGRHCPTADRLFSPISVGSRGCRAGCGVRKGTSSPCFWIRDRWREYQSG